MSGNALDHSAIRTGPGSGEGQQAINGAAFDHLAFKAGPWHSDNTTALMATNDVYREKLTITEELQRLQVCL